MSKKLKILVVRFSSIGDIILTTPVLRCINSQIDAEIHYLTKASYLGVLDSNPYITKIIFINNDFIQTINELKKENYDVIIDLHNNLRSFILKYKLRIDSYTVSKHNIKRQILIHFGIDLLGNHIVDRYFKTVEKLQVYNDNSGVDYFVNNETDVNYNVNQDYVAWCIGATHNQKKLSVNQIQSVADKITIPIVLLGGDNDREDAERIIRETESNRVFSFCGDLSINQSAYLIKNSKLLLTNDTGMMHIGASFDIPVVSFWGCTKPSLGFSPYMMKNKDLKIVSKMSKKPCSKHGSYCQFSKDGCIKSITPETIYESIKELV